MPSNQVCQSFINSIAPLVVKYAKQYGYHIASTIIAQACCESAYGTSPSGNHNYFGMKCGGAWKGKSVNLKTKEEYQPGVLTNISDNFRVYDSFEEGVKGYFDFIAWSHYADLKKCYDYKSYAQTLKNKGYATSSTYVSTLCSIVEKWNLTQYDWEKVQNPQSKPSQPAKPKETICEVTILKPILRFGSIGDDVRLLQFLLNLKGSDCGNVDGNFGPKTKAAVGNYQADHADCGSIDYICGPKTWTSLLS